MPRQLRGTGNGVYARRAGRAGRRPGGGDGRPLAPVEHFMLDPDRRPDRRTRVTV